MSEPVLRRSGRNVAKKEAAPPPAPAAVAAPTRKRSSAEPKKPAPKKAKVKAAATTATTTTTAEAEPPAKNDEAAAPSSSSKVATVVATAAKSAKPAPKTAKAKKGEQAAEGAPALGDGDALPKDLPEIQTHDGTKTSLTALLEKAQKGIVIFAYPKAQTPGCTTQACLFRDRFTEFANAGYTVFGLSGDSPAANEKFKTKQNLSYTLLCDPTFELHEKFGIKKQPKGTIRSIIVIEKSDDASSPGKVIKKAPASPQVSLTLALQAVGIESGSAAGASGSAAAVATEKAEENKVPDAASTAVDAAA